MEYINIYYGTWRAITILF